MIHNIILELSERFESKNIEDIITSSENKTLYSNQIPWDPTILSFGYPAIALFYIQLFKISQDLKWKKLCHKYIEKTIQSFNNSINSNISMFGGLSGICFVVWKASENGKNYSNLLKKLDEKFFFILDHKIRILKDKVFLNTEDYDPIQGISGILRYLILRKNDPKFFEYALKLTNILNFSENKIYFNDKLIPRWFLNVDDQLIEQDKNIFPNGSFNIGLAHGVSSILSSLSIAKINGIDDVNIEKSINNIVNWVLKWRMNDNYGTFWPGRISYEDELNNDFSFKNYQIKRQAWCYGTPGTSRSLFLASKALKNKNLEDLSVKSFLEIFDRPEDEWQCHSPSFCHGYSGILQIAKRFYYDTKIQKIEIYIKEMEKNIMSFYSNENPFLFMNIERNGFNIKEQNNVGIIEGVTGIALSLIDCDNFDSCFWDNPFLIS